MSSQAALDTRRRVAVGSADQLGMITATDALSAFLALQSISREYGALG